MKSSQVNKLYSKLTPHEQAALCFEAAVRRDDAELEAIKSAIEWGTYQCPNYDFRQRSYGLFMLAAQYGIEYWKNRALMLVACEMAEDGSDKTDQAANQFFVKTIALELALIEVCKLIRVDVRAIKKMASCPPDEAKGFELPEVDAELVKQYEEMLGGLVEP